jgi:hypothetical protein
VRRVGRWYVGTRQLPSLDAGPLATVTPSVQFPVGPDASARFQVDARGTPFPILGRHLNLIFSLSPTDYGFVLDDTLAKGFNSIYIKVPITPGNDNGTGRDADGNLPFAKRLDGATYTGSFTFSDINNEAPDFNTTAAAEPFWRNFDRFLAACLTRGLLVFWQPAYVGFHNTDWWMGLDNILVANGAAKLEAYGAWVAGRYQNQKNLVWMLGGDKGTDGTPFSSPETAVLTGFHTGLKSVVTASAQYSALWLRDSIAKDLFASDITLNGTYAAALQVNNQGARAWAFSPTTPAYMQECPLEPGSGIVRRFMAWGWLSSVGGYMFLNGDVAAFVPTYLANLNTQGTLDTKRLNELIRSIQWWKLAPDNAAISAGGGTVDTETQVAVASSFAADGGSLLFAYCPPSHTGTLTLTMSRMRGLTRARWWDPTNGAYTDDSSGLANSGTHEFTKPGTNALGDNDWLLRLDA